MNTFKKQAIFCLVLACVVVVTGVSGIFLARAAGGAGLTQKAFHYNLPAYDISEVDRVNIVCNYGAVTILPTNEQNITAAYTGYGTGRFTEGLTLDTTLQNGVLNITVRFSNLSRFFTFGTALLSHDALLTVYLPDDDTLDLDVRASAGKLDVQAERLGDVTLDCSAGKITLPDAFRARSLAINASAGAVRIPRAVIAETLTVECSAGSIWMGEIQAKSTKIKSSAGNVELESLLGGALEVRCSAGKAVVAVAQLDGDISIHSSASNVTLTLPGDAAFRLSARASAGRISCDFPLSSESSSSGKLAGTVGAGTYAVQIESSAGGITLRRA